MLVARHCSLPGGSGTSANLVGFAGDDRFCIHQEIPPQSPLGYVVPPIGKPHAMFFLEGNAPANNLNDVVHGVLLPMQLLVPIRVVEETTPGRYQEGWVVSPRTTLYKQPQMRGKPAGKQLLFHSGRPIVS